MKILFGQIEGEYLEDNIANGSNMFECDGKYFDFVLDINEDSVHISDTMGRYVPIGIHEFASFAKAVKIANNYTKALVKYSSVVDQVNDDEILYVE